MLRLSGLLLLPNLVVAAPQSLFEVAFAAQPLEQALNQFSRTLEQTLLYDPEIVQQHHAQSVQGRYSAQQLIESLLQQTSLCAEEIASGWLIKRCEHTPLTTQKAKPVAAPVVFTQPQLAEEIIVTGFRDSLIKAKEIKRLALISQDTILAEDIADFPDLNLADSLQRIPGVSITREAGEGRQISLRGLGPDFTRVTINGIEAMGMTSSPMDARGAVSRSRAFDFNIFSAELFNRIDIQKSFSAAIEEGGIGGTVALNTPKPLDFKTTTKVFSYRQGYNSNSLEYDPSVSLLYAQPWQNWGSLIAMTYSQRSTTEYGTNTTRWRKERKTYTGEHNPALSEKLANSEFWFPRGHRYSLWNNQQQRLGVTAALQYQPSDQFNMTLNLLHNQLANDLDEHHLAVKNNHQVEALEWRDNQGEQEVTYAKYKHASWRAETREDFNKSTYQQVSIASQMTINPATQLSLVIGGNRADYQQPKVNKVNIVADDVDIVTDFRHDDFYGLSYSAAFDTTDAAAFTVKDLYFQENYVSSEIVNLKTDLHHRFHNSAALELGFSFKTLKNQGHDRVMGGFPVQTLPPDNAYSLLLPAGASEVYRQHPDYTWLQADLAAIQQHYGLANYALTEQAIIDASNYAIKESTHALYAAFEFDTLLFAQPLTYNLGLRWFNTHLLSEGFSKGTYTNIERDYNDYLPSLNLLWDFNHDMLLRFGAGKNITRPSIASLSFSANVSQSSRDEGDIGTVAIGNPYLAPFESVNLDTAYEWYFSEQGLLSLALFYKDIDNFVVEQSEMIPYRRLGLPTALLQPSDAIDDLFIVSKPVNADSATIHGFEFVLAKELDFLPSPLDKLGVIANFTWADGKTLYRDVQGRGENQLKTFAGLSKQSYNFTLYYEADNWSARISSAYRSEYILSLNAGTTDQDESGYHATNYIDVSASYQLSKHLALTLEGLNLSNQRQELYSDSNDRAYNTTTSGRSYFFGITAQF